MMRVIFNSLEEVVNFIKSSNRIAMEECSEEMKRILEKQMHDEITGFSGQMFDSVVSHSTNNIAEVGFEDTGDWTSLITGESVGNPIKFTEAGTTWGKDATNIMASATETCENEIPIEYKNIMNSLGIPVR